MADAGVTIDDAEVRRMLKLAPKQIDRAMRGGVSDTAALGERWARRYPAKVPGSSYDRRHNLQRSWSTKIKGRGIRVTGEIGSNSNMAPYNRLVMDYPKQAEVHRGRWQTIQTIAARLEPRLNKFISDRIRRELR